MRYLLKNVILIFIVMLTVAGALAADDLKQGLLFHAGFENTLTADLARGNPEPFVVCPIDAPIFRDNGVKGRCVECGTGFVTELSYFNAGNYSAPAGTVAFWIQPVDWQGAAGKDNKYFHLFFQGIPGKGYSGIYMQRFVQAAPTLTYYSIQFPDRKDIYLPFAASTQWGNGQWHHIALTWDATEAKFYVDGTPVAAGKITKPFTAADVFAERFLLGCNGNEHTLLDEVGIWGRPLSAAEVAQLRREKR